MPFTVKENIDVAGSADDPWRRRPRRRRRHRSTRPIVERMRAAGAIPFARTNLPDLGLRVHTDSSLRGLTRNPWNPDRHRRRIERRRGGRAGQRDERRSGSATTSAARCATRPTAAASPRSSRRRAWCRTASCLPPEDPTIMFQLMAVEGVMARHVADVRAGLLAVAGRPSRDPLSLPVVLGRTAAGRRLRVAVVRRSARRRRPTPASPRRSAAPPTRWPTPATSVERGRCRPTYERAIELWAELLMPRHPRRAPAARRRDGRRTAARFLDLADERLRRRSTSAAVVDAVHLERHGVLRDWDAFFDRRGTCCSRPTWTHPAFAHGADIASVDGALAHAGDDAPGVAGQPARAAGRRRAVRSRRRAAGRRPAHGAPVRRLDGARRRAGRRGRRRRRSRRSTRVT